MYKYSDKQLYGYHQNRIKLSIQSRQKLMGHIQREREGGERGDPTKLGFLHIQRQICYADYGQGPIQQYTNNNLNQQRKDICLHYKKWCVKPLLQEFQTVQCLKITFLIRYR